MEDGERAVWILAHFDACLDVMGPRLGGGKLQPSGAEDDSVVARHDALLLDAQGLGKKGRIDRLEGGLCEGCGPCEAGIVPWQVDLSDEAIGGLGLRDVGEREFLD